TFARAGQHQEVLTLYDQLPADLQRDKNVLLMRLRAAQAVGDDKYAEAMRDFRTYHSDDPCIDFLSITYYLQTKEFARALQMIDRVEKAIDGDPYLNLLRALVHTEAGDILAARKDDEKALAEEPTLLEAHWDLVRIAMLEKNFTETLERLREIER